MNEEARSGAIRLMEFADRMLDYLVQADFQPDREWLQNVRDYAQRKELIYSRSEKTDDPVLEEYTRTWERLV